MGARCAPLACGLALGLAGALLARAGEWAQASVRLIRVARLPGESLRSAPRCKVGSASGLWREGGPDTLEILSWERKAGQESFLVRSLPDGSEGKIFRRTRGHTSVDQWFLSIGPSAAAAAEMGTWPLDTGHMDGLLDWATHEVVTAAEDEHAAFSVDPSTRAHVGDGVVCFELTTFFSHLRSSRFASPVLLPHGALRLQSRPVLDLIAAAQEALRTGESLDALARGTKAHWEELIKLLLSRGARRLVGREDLSDPADLLGADVGSALTYFTEVPLNSASWLFGPRAHQAKHLWSMLEASEDWPVASGPPAVWVEAEAKLFVGDPGTGTAPHTDILWLPQLLLVLDGEKCLAVRPGRVPHAPGERSVLSVAAGDLCAFNAALEHAAANRGRGPTAALFQGFLPVAAVPSFCSRPAPAAEAPRQTEDTHWLLRGGGNGGLSLGERLGKVAADTGWRRGNHDERMLKIAAAAVNSAMKRFGLAASRLPFNSQSKDV